MKLQRILILLTIGAVCALPSASLAGAGKANKAGKGAGKGQHPGHAIHALDKNTTGQIDGDEIEALKKDFAADPKGALAVLDKNSNGTLEDDEITALNARMSKHAERVAKKGGAKKGKKKATT